MNLEKTAKTSRLNSLLSGTKCNPKVLRYHLHPDWNLKSSEYIPMLMMHSSWTAFALKMRQIGCPETSVTHYQSVLRNITEERRSHLHCARRLILNFWLQKCKSWNGFSVTFLAVHCFCFLPPSPSLSVSLSLSLYFSLSLSLSLSFTHTHTHTHTHASKHAPKLYSY